MGCKPSDWPQGYNINQPLIPTCLSSSFSFRLSRVILSAFVHRVTCAKRFTSIFCCYSCICSSCPIHFALQVPFSGVLFGVSSFHFVQQVLVTFFCS